MPPCAKAPWTGHRTHCIGLRGLAPGLDEPLRNFEKPSPSEKLWQVRGKIRRAKVAGSAVIPGDRSVRGLPREPRDWNQLGSHAEHYSSRARPCRPRKIGARFRSCYDAVSGRPNPRRKTPPSPLSPCPPGCIPACSRSNRMCRVPHQDRAQDGQALRRRRLRIRRARDVLAPGRVQVGEKVRRYAPSRGSGRASPQSDAPCAGARVRSGEGCGQPPRARSIDGVDRAAESWLRSVRSQRRDTR